jgi:hypothetical protein
VAHTGCCKPTQADKRAWLERRLEALQQETKAVEDRLTALGQEEPEEAQE